jgi:hypothetical protein
MSFQGTTVKEFHEHLAHVIEQVRVIGVAEAGLIALGFSDLTSTMAPAAPVLIGSFVTGAVLTAWLLGRAWIEFQDARRTVTRGATCTDALLPTDQTSHDQYEKGSRFERTAIVVLIVSALCYVAAAWCWVIHPPADPSPAALAPITDSD